VRILVTGGAGFIGAHLCAELDAHGHQVTVMDRKIAPALDARDSEKLVSLFERDRSEVLIHLAARVGRLFGEDDVRATIADNTGMTATVAKACGENGVRLVFASTSEVYGDRGMSLCYESSPRVLPHNAYGLSKAHAEEFCRLYAPDDLTILRLSMPYGPGLPAGRGRAAIVNMLHQAENRQPIPVHRGAERSHCWIGDTVRAVRLTLGEPGGAFNIGRDDQPTLMRDVARIACELTGAPESLIHEVDSPARQTIVKRLATNKIRALGWKPEVDLREGMQRTLEWVRSLEAVAA
jgi:nucleoside-diphosphate-sugar epimerase